MKNYLKSAKYKENTAAPIFQDYLESPGKKEGVRVSENGEI